MEEPRKAYYSIIPADVRYDENLTANAKLLYGEITALCNERGYCWATNDYFAGLYKVSKVSISKWISSLISAGYIESELEYREGTKEILNRYLRIVKYPIKEKLNTPIKEKFKDNNTDINNTYIYSPSDDEQQSFDFPKTDLEEKLAEDFEKIWEIYPRKDGKNTAFNHYKAWLKGKKYAGKTVKLTNRQMWYAVDKYSKEIEQEKKEKRFIKMGSTFFNEAIMEYVETEE